MTWINLHRLHMVPHVCLHLHLFRIPHQYMSFRPSPQPICHCHRYYVYSGSGLPNPSVSLPFPPTPISSTRLHLPPPLLLRSRLLNPSVIVTVIRSAVAVVAVLVLPPHPSCLPNPSVSYPFPSTTVSSTRLYPPLLL